MRIITLSAYYTKTTSVLHTKTTKIELISQIIRLGKSRKRDTGNTYVLENPNTE